VKSYVLVVLMTGLAATAAANTILSVGTPGEPAAAVDARALGMGGAALALADGSNLNGLNPAVWASLKRAGFNLTAVRGYNSYETAQGKSVNVNYDVPGVEIALPAAENLTVAFSFREKLNQNYEVTAPLEFGGERIGTSERRGVGGLYALRLGAARRLSARWLAGLNAGYDFGAPEEVYTKTFTEKGYSDVQERLATSYRGVGGALGIVWLTDDHLSFGAAAELYARHSCREETSNDYVTLIESDHQVDLPYAGGVGAAYIFGPRARAALDVRYTAWSGFRVDGVGQGFRDTVEVRAGAEGRINAGRKGFFLWRMPYRCGAFYAPWYGRDYGTYTAFGVTAGAGYLFQNNEDSRFDAAFEYVRRGSAATAVREEQMNFYISVVGVETWFGKQQEEGE